MPGYRLVPSDDPGGFIDFDGADPSSSLHVASTRRIEDADIYQDGEYIFSLRQNGVGSCWIIQSRAGLMAHSGSRKEHGSMV